MIALQDIVSKRKGILSYIVGASPKRRRNFQCVCNHTSVLGDAITSSLLVGNTRLHSQELREKIYSECIIEEESRKLVLSASVNCIR